MPHFCNSFINKFDIYTSLLFNFKIIIFKEKTEVISFSTNQN
nr:MAG TPA: hypothetical protein [Ackermannviridae sp.]